MATSPLPGSEIVILELDNLSSATNHNGGALAFGPDGKLYAAVGENANGANAQTLSNLLGKMLRINTDGSIPTDNPFYTTATGRNRAIWALGLRNPFTFAFDPGRTRRCSSTTWARTRGRRSTTASPAPTTAGQRPKGATTDPKLPLAAIRLQPLGAAAARSRAARSTRRSFASSRRATPATTSSPTTAAAGSARSIRPQANTVENFAAAISFPVDLKVSDDGALYYLARGTGATTGAVYRIEYGAGRSDDHTAPVRR